MTINEAIARVDALKPNTYDDKTKTRWLSDLDGRLSMEVMGAAEPAQYLPETPGTQELLISAPYEQVYEHYLGAMIDYTNREYLNYNNSMPMFNTIYEDFRRYYIRTNAPADTGNFKYVF